MAIKLSVFEAKIRKEKATGVKKQQYKPVDNTGRIVVTPKVHDDGSFDISVKVYDPAMKETLTPINNVSHYFSNLVRENDTIKLAILTPEVMAAILAAQGREVTSGNIVTTVITEKMRESLPINALEGKNVGDTLVKNLIRQNFDSKVASKVYICNKYAEFQINTSAASSKNVAEVFGIEVLKLLAEGNRIQYKVGEDSVVDIKYTTNTLVDDKAEGSKKRYAKAFVSVPCYDLTNAKVLRKSRTEDSLEESVGEVLETSVTGNEVVSY